MDGYEQLEKARDRVIEAFAQNMNLYGVTPSVGRLYGMLYFQEGPLTLDEMKVELGMSKTSMSTSVRNLLDLKMVDKVWKKGVRKDLYEVEQDWYQTFIDFFTIKWRAGIIMNVQAVEKSIAELKSIIENEHSNDELKEKAKQDLEKLHQALQYYDWLDRLVDTFESHDIFSFVPKDQLPKT
ncbi:GbsR/MarR family transcriptional regulator [Bacillus timonensis]|nr:GbsR/MarR family transcriptional regulator [Bacillus timonensis]